MARNWMLGWRNVRQIISYRVNRRGLTVVMLFRKQFQRPCRGSPGHSSNQVHSAHARSGSLRRAGIVVKVVVSYPP